MSAATSHCLKIGGDTESLPYSCFLQSCEIVLLHRSIRIAAEQQSQRRVSLLRQLDDRLSRLFRVTRLLPVVVALKSCGSSNSRVVCGMTFAQFGGTPREVCTESTGFNNCDLNAEWCHFARQHFREAFGTPFRRRIRTTSRRTNPSSNR